MAAPNFFKPRKPKYFGSMTAKQVRRRRMSRKRAPIKNADQEVITALVKATPGDLTPEQIAAAATLLKRSTASVVKAVESARNTLQNNAERYAQIHIEAAEKALASDDPRVLEVARRAAEYALNNISARDQQGTRINIVERDQKSSGPSNARNVRIGIAFGHLRSTEQSTPTVDAEIINE